MHGKTWDMPDIAGQQACPDVKCQPDSCIVMYSPDAGSGKIPKAEKGGAMSRADDFKQKKTIWIIDHYASEPEYGGISRHYDFAGELDRRGYRAVVFASGFSHFTHSGISEKEVFITRPFQHVRYVYLKTTAYEENQGAARAGNMIVFMLQVLKYESLIARYYGKPDVVEGCSVHPLAWIAAYCAARKYRARFVAEVRDFWPQIWIASGRMKPAHPMALFFSAIENFAFQHADRIICSLYHGDRYICGEKSVPFRKTCLIGQPIDCERYDKNSEKTKLIPDKIRTFISDGFICTFTGYFMEYEGVKVMLEAQKILQDRGIFVKMVFVGSGREKDAMIQYVKANHLENVLIGNRIPKEAVPALLRNSDVCMAHIEYKGQENVFQYGMSKNKVNEYMYSGACTLLGFRFTDNEVIENGAGLQYEPYNAADLASKIEYLYKMKEADRKKFGERARLYMQKNHSVKVLTDRLLEALFK